MDDPATCRRGLCPLPARSGRRQPHHLHPSPDAALARSGHPRPARRYRPSRSSTSPAARATAARDPWLGRRRGRRGAAQGIDLNPRSAVAAAAQTPPGMAITWRTGDVFDHAPEPAPDYIVTSQFTHHLADADVVRFLRWLERHAARGWFIADLHRSRFAYWGFGLLATVARWHPIVRQRRHGLGRPQLPPRRLAAAAGRGRAHRRDPLAAGLPLVRRPPEMIYPNQPQTAAAVAAHYDELDPFYREIWGEHVHHGYWATGRESPRRRPRRWSTSSPTGSTCAPGQAVCDIGCGYGATAQRLAERHGVARHRVTISAAQARWPPRGVPARWQPAIRQQDWLANGFPDAALRPRLRDRELRAHGGQARFFAEACRTLRPGGRLVVCAWLAGATPRPWEVRHLLEPICREGRLPGMGDEADYRTPRQRGRASRSPVSRTSATRCAGPGRSARAGSATSSRPSHDTPATCLDRRTANRVFALTLLPSAARLPDRRHALLPDDAGRAGTSHALTGRLHGRPTGCGHGRPPGRMLHVTRLQPGRPLDSSSSSGAARPSGT